MEENQSLEDSARPGWTAESMKHDIDSWQAIRISRAHNKSLKETPKCVSESMES